MIEIRVNLEEVKGIYALLEKLKDFLHQPMNYDSRENFEAFAKSIYPEIHKSYYETVWKWLPIEVQKEIEEQ